MAGTVFLSRVHQPVKPVSPPLFWRIYAALTKMTAFVAATEPLAFSLCGICRDMICELLDELYCDLEEERSTMLTLSCKPSKGGNFCHNSGPVN